MIKVLAKLFAILIILGVIAFFALKVPDTDAQLMKTKYGSADSQQVADGLGGFIHYRDQGNKNGPVLFLVHGANSSLHTWEAMVDELSDQFRLISYDQHGHGITGPHPLEDYSASAKIQAATVVLDAVGVEKATWVGNSMGGWLTWRAALTVPERFNGMVLIDSSGVQGGEAVTLYFGARLAQSWIGQTLRPYIMPRSLIRSSIEDNYVDNSKINDALVDRYWELLRYPGNRKSGVIRANTDRQNEKWQEVGSIQLPTLLLWGQLDSVTPVSHAKAFHSAIANSSLIIYPNAGHLPMEELPEQVANDIRQWHSANNSAFFDEVLP